MNTTYYVAYNNGISDKLKAKTLLGAKREVSKELAFGCGDATIYQDAYDNPICIRDFWQNCNTFGWNKWEDIN